MDAPQVQYTQTADGVSIAFYATGSGYPLVVTPVLGPSHLTLERQFPTLNDWYQHISRHRTLIRWDTRNNGMSDRDVDEVSDAAYDRDIEAVLRAVSVERVDLLAAGPGASAAIGFVVRHPDMIRKLVLINALPRFLDQFPGERGEAILSLAERDWRLFTENAARARLGWSQSDAGAYARFLRASSSQRDMLRSIPWWRTLDATPLLSAVNAETLVIYGVGASFWGKMYQSAARVIASSVPVSRVMEIRRAGEDWFGSPEVRDAIDHFIEVPSQATSRVESTSASSKYGAGLTVVLFTDLAASTALTQRLGDAGAQELVREHNAIVREALPAHSGTEIKHTGDGIMASFPTASGAIECAVAIQRAVAEQDNADLQVYIGLNAGEPIAEEKDLFGTSVQLARRLVDHAEAGQILVSNVVRELAAGKEFLFADTGEVALKGFEEPVRLYEVRWRE